LPDIVVKTGSVNSFKRRLDQDWLKQEVIFNYTIEFAGTGDCLDYAID